MLVWDKCLAFQGSLLLPCALCLVPLCLPSSFPLALAAQSRYVGGRVSRGKGKVHVHLRMPCLRCALLWFSASTVPASSRIKGSSQDGAGWTGRCCVSGRHTGGYRVLLGRHPTLPCEGPGRNGLRAFPVGTCRVHASFRRFSLLAALRCSALSVSRCSCSSGIYHASPGGGSMQQILFQSLLLVLSSEIAQLAQLAQAPTT